MWVTSWKTTINNTEMRTHTQTHWIIWPNKQSWIRPTRSAGFFFPLSHLLFVFCLRQCNFPGCDSALLFESSHEFYRNIRVHSKRTIELLWIRKCRSSSNKRKKKQFFVCTRNINHEFNWIVVPNSKCLQKQFRLNCHTIDDECDAIKKKGAKPIRIFIITYTRQHIRSCKQIHQTRNANRKLHNCSNKY